MLTTSKGRFYGKFLSRWKWSHTCWTTRCVMNVRVHGAAESLRLFSAQMSPVSSTTVNNAGKPSTRRGEESSTNRLSKKVLIDLGVCPIAGVNCSIQTFSTMLKCYVSFEKFVSVETLFIKIVITKFIQWMNNPYIVMDLLERRGYNPKNWWFSNIIFSLWLEPRIVLLWTRAVVLVLLNTNKVFKGFL